MGSNIDDYQLQLRSVEQALLTVVNDDDRAALLSLKDNLLELLELTRQTSRLNDNEVVVTSKQGLLAEVNNASADCNGVPDGHTICNNADGGLDLNELQKQLESMVGQKCSAPHKHTWGAVSYHNAIICGIGDSAELCNGGLSAVYMRVLFTNPTHREMLPCSYFLEGDCKFDDTNCHFSHGELVPFSDLREYSEPDFGKLMRNCVVLAKMQDRMWHKGRVLCSNFVEKSCRVRLEDNKHKNKEMEFPFENLFPIFHDEDLSSGSSSDEDTNSDSEELNDLEVARQTCRIEHDLFTFPLSQPLGEWEKHTRGIGSKLMAKMGYIYGTGLGWNGRGIVTPISGQILPQGCSLDHCMQLREAAKGDKDLFSVEKKLNEQKKKLDVLNAKAYEREKQRVDVFSFLNESVLKRNTRDDADSTKKLDKPSLKNQTTKSLNVESVRIADDIRKKTREITRIAESMRRHAVDTNVYKRLKDQMNSATNELNDLKQAESSLAREQATRKTKDKLCIF